MKLYLLSQNENSGYDTYDSMVVAAEDEYDAIRMHPSAVLYFWNDSLTPERWCYATGSREVVPDAWLASRATDIENVNCTLLGEAWDIEEGVICASFNAG